MQPFFDLDKLHKKQNRQQWLRLGISGVVIVVVSVVGVTLLGSKQTPTQHIATVSYGTSNSSTDNPSNPSSTTTLSPSDVSSLNQQIAQEQAQAAQDEANAAKDIANAQDAQSSLNSETPPVTSSLTPITIPTTSTTTPSPPTCNVPSDLNALFTQYNQAEATLNNFETNPSAKWGLDANGYNVQLASLETAASNAYNAYAAAEAQVHC